MTPLLAATTAAAAAVGERVGGEEGVVVDGAVATIVAIDLGLAQGKGGKSQELLTVPGLVFM